MRIENGKLRVEQLGSGVPRILQSYSKDCFVFGDSFTRMIFRFEGNIILHTSKAIEQVTEQVKKILTAITDREYTSNGMMTLLKLKHRPTFLYQYLQPAIKLGLLKMTLPNKPKSSKQKYRLTDLGKNIKNNLNGE